MIPQPHCNIVTFYQAYRTTNNVYLFLELCDQGDLNQFIKKRNSSNFKLSECEAKYILRDVVRGLRHLSKVCKIMHRDIKLDNILVKQKLGGMGDFSERKISDFEFKLGDLGLAKSILSEKDLQNTVCGTPLYMAPEVIGGGLYNSKADVWSLGTLLFQMLTGEYPFFGKDLSELKQNVKLGVYKIPKEVQVSFECIDFLNSCLKFDQSKRKNWDQLLAHPFLLDVKMHKVNSKTGLM